MQFIDHLLFVACQHQRASQRHQQQQRHHFKWNQIGGHKEFAQVGNDDLAMWQLCIDFRPGHITQNAPQRYKQQAPP